MLAILAVVWVDLFQYVGEQAPRPSPTRWFWRPSCREYNAYIETEIGFTKEFCMSYLDTFEGSAEFQAELAVQRTFMARVYSWMTLGLLVTALTALVVGSSVPLMKIVLSGGIWVLIIAELAIAFTFRLALRVTMAWPEWW